MRWWTALLAAGITMASLVPGAGAQPDTPFEAGGGLWLSAEGSTPGLASVAPEYVLRPAPDASPGRVPLATSTGYYAGWSITMSASVNRTYTYLEDGVFRLALECAAPLPNNVLYVDASLTLTVGTQVVRGTNDPALTTACLDRLQLEIPLRIAGLRLLAGETVELSLTVQQPNPPAAAPDAALVYAVTGDEDAPTGLFAHWTDLPLTGPLTVERTFDGSSTFDEVLFYATDAPSVTVRAEGTTDYDLGISVQDVTTGDTVYEMTVDTTEPRSFDRAASIVAGNGTRWVVHLDTFGFPEGSLRLTLVPVLELPEELVPPSNATAPPANTTGNATATPAPTPAGDEEGSPFVAVPAAATLLAAVAWRRRR